MRGGRGHGGHTGDTKQPGRNGTVELALCVRDGEGNKSVEQVVRVYDNVKALHRQIHWQGSSFPIFKRL